MTKTEKEAEAKTKPNESINGLTQHKQENKKKTTEKQENIEKTETGKDNNEALNPAQSKYPISFHGCMRPDVSISHHPAFPLLLKFATEGCPVDCGEPWMQEHLEVAINRKPHISARSPEAVAAL